MFPKLTEVKVLPDYKLHLTYSDGAAGVFDFARHVGFDGVFEKLRDPAEFQRARISRNVWKNLTWPGELDLDPVQVYSDVTGRSIDWILAQEEQARPRRKRKAKAGDMVGKGL